MASLNISLPQSLKDYVETQVSACGYRTPSEYLRELLRQDQKQRAPEKLEAALLEGLNSGAPIDITPEYWDRKRAQLITRDSNNTGPRLALPNSTSADVRNQNFSRKPPI